MTRDLQQLCGGDPLRGEPECRPRRFTQVCDASIHHHAAIAERQRAVDRVEGAQIVECIRGAGRVEGKVALWLKLCAADLV